MDLMITSATTIRLLDLSYAGGTQQLATSEAIMQAVGAGTAPPTLRLYSWSEPVVILGVGQPTADLNREICLARGYRILRRIGGGTAVYHDADEVSIDLIVPSGHRLGPTDVHAGYRQFSRFLADGLRDLGIQVDTVSIEEARAMTNDEVLRPICFASISPYEFFHDQRKLNGLCQIRRRDVIAYQAAIYNRFPIEPMLASLIHENEKVRKTRAEKLASFTTDMATARGRPVDYEELQRSLAAAARKTLGVEVHAGELSDEERLETERLIGTKYASDEWTFRR
jgi:lipoyl(octanoyl) transferase